MKMKKIGVIITRAPYGYEDAFAGLYVGTASLSRGMEATVFLLGDGVYTAMKGHGDTMKLIHLPPTEPQVKDIIDLGGRVLVDREAAAIRGVTQEESIEGVEFVDSKKLLDEIEAIDLTATF